MFVRGGINLVLVTLRDIIHRAAVSQFFPAGMKNITPSQVQAFTVRLCRPWQNRDIIMWNYWYKQSDLWHLTWGCFMFVYMLILSLGWVSKISKKKKKEQEENENSSQTEDLRNISVFKSQLNKYYFTPKLLLEKAREKDGGWGCGVLLFIISE